MTHEHAQNSHQRKGVGAIVMR